MWEIRRLEEQFEPETVLRINKLQADASSLPIKDGAGRYYAKELIYSLEAGLLLASLHLTSSLLELFVRDLLIYTYLSQQPDENPFSQINNLERKYEDENKPIWSFARMVDTLCDLGVIESADVDSLKQYYSKVRIPIHHGLTRRFVRIHDQFSSDVDEENGIGDLLYSRLGRAHTIENLLEDQAIELLEEVMLFMKTHSHHFGDNGSF